MEESNQTMPENNSDLQPTANQFLFDNDDYYLIPAKSWPYFGLGIRFQPEDYELILDYLSPKINGQESPTNFMHDVNIYNFNPKYLAANYRPQGDDKKWYFITTRDKKYPHGSRPNRMTRDGYWKATGSDIPIIHGGVQVGSRKSLVYYEGKPSEGVKTPWIMHEFTVPQVLGDDKNTNTIKISDDHENINMRLDDFVLCRIYKSKKRQRKNKGTKNEVQAEGGEEEDDDDEQSTDDEALSSYDDDHVFHEHIIVDDPGQYVSSLPSGYKFNPLDYELILDFLSPKINGEQLLLDLIYEDNIYNFSPEYLAANYQAQGGNSWYFFTPRDRKYPNGSRPDRKAGDGYWKATGADVAVNYKGMQVGSRKSLVYYEGKPSEGVKTRWIMHEFKVVADSSQANNAIETGDDTNTKVLTNGSVENTNMRLDGCVLCRIYKKEQRQRKKRGRIDDGADNMQGGGGGEEQRPPPPDDHLSFTLSYLESLNTYNTNPNNNNNIIVYNDEDNNNNNYVGVFEEKNEILDYIRAMFLTDDLPDRLREAFSRSDNEYDAQIRCQDLGCATSHTHMNPPSPRPPPQATAQPADDALQNSSLFGQDETFEQRITDEEEYDATTPQDQAFDEWLIANGYSDAMPQQDQTTIQQQPIDDELIPHQDLDDVPQQPHTSIQHCTCGQCPPDPTSLPDLSIHDVELLLRGR